MSMLEKTRASFGNDVLNYIADYVVAQLKKEGKRYYQWKLKGSDLGCILDIMPGNSMTVVVPTGENGQVSHAVTIVGKWIFDANEIQALPLTQESLDICCGQTCVGIQRGRFICERMELPVARPETKERKRKKRKRNKK